ncbi:MAG TPA: GAF domain-containing protein [Stellaceae bacterium]|nr:GAF domain-containing protein [Stellaceae bacterium]
MALTDANSATGEWHHPTASQDHDVLGTPPGPAFDRLTRLAARLFNTPIALISLVDTDRQWFKSCVGLDVTEIDRSTSFCAHAILKDDVTVVLDATEDPHYAHDSLVTGAPGIRFYAGAPLVTADGYRLGSLCVIDTAPRTAFSSEQQAMLADLAALAIEALAGHRAYRQGEARHQAERYRLQDHVQAIVTASPIAFVTVDSEGVVTSWNQAAETIFGWTAEEALGTFLPFARESYTEWRRMADHLSRGEIFKGVETRRRRKDGSWIDVSIAAAPLTDHAGRYTGTVAMVDDITGRKQAERDRDATATRLRLENEVLVGIATCRALATGDLDTIIPLITQKAAEVLGSNRTSVWLLDEAARRVTCNFGAWGDPDGLLTGQSIEIEPYPEYFTALFEGRGIAMNDVGTDPRTARLRRAIPCTAGVASLLVSTIRVGDRVLGFLSCEQADNPRQWTADEQNFAASLADLTAMTIEAQERAQTARNLAIARDQAEAANRTKTNFLSNMSHELRTPLNAVIGFADMMCLEALGPLNHPTYRSYAADIADSGRHLLGIINDVLDIAKAEAGRLDLYDEAVCMAELVGQALRIVEPHAQTKNLTLRADMPATLPLVTIDRQRFLQAILNLVSNAVKFSRYGGSVSVTAALREDRGITIEVADTGIGMRPDQITRAFEPFTQIDADLNRSFEGTGLGLPLARHLIELHDGTLTLTSEPGIGTVASIHLPMQRVVETV